MALPRDAGARGEGPLIGRCGRPRRPDLPLIDATPGGRPVPAPWLPRADRAGREVPAGSLNGARTVPAAGSSSRLGAPVFDASAGPLAPAARRGLDDNVRDRT